MAQKAIITEYPDGQRVMSNIRLKNPIPVLGMNSTYTATQVTQWWDNTPMTDAKADGLIYLKHKTEGTYWKVNLPNEGENFLEKDTMAQMRALSSTEILLLRMGYYKGVRLSGYHIKEDTPQPINYILSDTTESDDGGSVIDVGGVKLEHEFGGKVDVVYFGAKDGEDCTERIQNCVNSVKEGSTVVINGNYFSTSDYGWFNQGIKLRSNIDLEINGSITLLPSPHGQYNIFSGYNLNILY